MVTQIMVKKEEIDLKDREKMIYNTVIKLKNGTKEQIQLAIECEKILANESSEYSLEEKLDIIEQTIKTKGIK